ncbi:hypothetical protein M9H77_30100 [Catharanthus roseus]|uniref:Uncharacterized protein n=1 Tax=Catharanthus roseus TaxID=4058 RepID=A0ACC0A0J8_CATRO|nr:hypothetical protein M9H77_30100 [Catharanthus roseus]
MGLGIYFLSTRDEDLHCAWLVPHTRASSEGHACRGYFLAGWVRRGSPVGVAQCGLVGTPKARCLLVYISCELEKSNVRTVCFGVQAGIDYGMLEFVSNDPV